MIIVPVPPIKTALGDGSKPLPSASGWLQFFQKVGSVLSGVWGRQRYSPASSLPPTDFLIQYLGDGGFNFVLRFAGGAMPSSLPLPKSVHRQLVPFFNEQGLIGVGLADGETLSLPSYAGSLESCASGFLFIKEAQ
jgi:hypothetical protein